MNSYKRLANNSVIFAVGTLGSRIISIVLVPLYTYYLTTSEYGTIDLVTTTVQLLIPLISVSMFDAVMRFVMDKDYDRNTVISNALTIEFIIFLLFILIAPFLSVIFNIIYLPYLAMMLFVQIIERTCAQYTRGIGQTKTFAINGILLTFSTGILNIFFLVYLNRGITGYFISIILANTVSIVFLIISTKVFKHISFGLINKEIMKDLLKYSLPMIPNSLMWWLINASSRYFITAFISLSANGLFAVASRIPALLNIVTQVFTSAWQLSAIEESSSENTGDFYTNVFKTLYTILFLGTILIQIILKPLFHYAFSLDYYEAWKIVPFLILGSVYSSFSSFFGANYIAAKKTGGVFRTSVICGISSLILNITLIPYLGLIGASISSFISFTLMFIIRYKDAKSMMNIVIDWKIFLINQLLIIFQIVVLFSLNNLLTELILMGIILLLFLVNNIIIVRQVIGLVRYKNPK